LLRIAVASAFFHPALPGEPLIFVQIALVKGIATAIQPLLSQTEDEAAAHARAADADTAIFYSISNCQDGLRGISFGNLLIKQVVEELKVELPGLSDSPRFHQFQASAGGWRSSSKPPIQP